MDDTSKDFPTNHYLFWKHVVGWEDPNKCWTWIGATQRGYGVCDARRYGTSRPHVFTYWELFSDDYDPQDNSYDLDHLCRNRACCNPSHLEKVKRAENLNRGPTVLTTLNKAKTHCPRGHEYDKINAQGRRCCTQCDREAVKRFRAKSKKL